MAMTCRRTEGGKAPGSTGAWGVLQAREAVAEVAVPPLVHGIAATVELRGHTQVGRLVRLSDAEDEATAEGQTLGRGAGAGERLQAFAFAVPEPTDVLI